MSPVVHSPERPLVPPGLRRASEWSWRLLLVAAAFAALAWALSKVFLVVIVVISALLLSTLFNPIADRLRHRGWRSGSATAVAMVAGLGVIGGLAWLIVPAVAGEFGAVGEQAATGVRQAQEWLVNGPLHLSNRQVDDLANGVVRNLRTGGGGIVNGVVTGAKTIGEVVAAVLLTIVLTVFFVKDGRLIWDWIVSLWPQESEPRVRQVGAITWETIGAYIRGIATIGLVDAVFIGLALVVLGVPLVLPLMVLTFIGAFIPLVGSTLAGAISALVALVDQGVVTALILVGAIILIQQIEGHVLYPVVMRRAVKVHPVAILVGVAVGTLVVGIFGAIISVPVVAILGRLLAILRSEQEATLEASAPVGDRAILLDPVDGRPAADPVVLDQP